MFLSTKLSNRQNGIIEVKIDRSVKKRRSSSIGMIKELLIKLRGMDTPYGRKLNLSFENKHKNVQSLEPMEREVFLLLLEGYTLKETAQILKTELSAVNAYQSEILKKLSVKTTAELILNYYDIETGKGGEL